MPRDDKTPMQVSEYKSACVSSSARIPGRSYAAVARLPRLVAMNNEPAVMRIGPDGLTLSITSQISADGLVHMNVSPKIATGARPGPSASTGTVIEVDTAVRVRGGDTVVIAGLIREEPETATGSSHGTDGGKDRRTSRTELVVLLTPTVVSVSAGSVPAAGAQ